MILRRIRLAPGSASSFFFGTTADVWRLDQGHDDLVYIGTGRRSSQERAELLCYWHGKRGADQHVDSFVHQSVRLVLMTAGKAL